LNLIGTKTDLSIRTNAACDAWKGAASSTRGATSKFEQQLVDSRDAMKNAAAVDSPSISRPDKVRNPFALWEKDVGFSFGDFIDIINPLQHIPIVATVYRNFSGDQIGAASRVIGGAMWGRVGGLIAGLANVVVEWWSGKDLGDHIYAAIFNPASKNGSAVASRQEHVPTVTKTKSPPAAPSRAEAPGVPSLLEPEILSPLSRANFFYLDPLPKSRSWLA
jgi:hypothetical protein